MSEGTHHGETFERVRSRGSGEQAGQAAEAASQAGIHSGRALHDGRRLRRLLPGVRRAATPGARVMMHVHGFGLSGRYLLPTAQVLADEFHTLVPDLPGFGRSAKAGALLDVPDLAHAAARFLDSMGIERATLVGNSMGCPVICEFAYRYPERIDRAVLVSPAGGLYNQPLRRAMGQLSKDGPREPRKMVTRRDARLPALRRAQHRQDVQGADPVPHARAPSRADASRRWSCSGTGTRCCRGRSACRRSPRRPTTTCSWCGSRAPRTPSTSVIRASCRTSSGCSWTTSRSSMTPTPPGTPVSTRSTGGRTTRRRKS